MDSINPVWIRDTNFCRITKDVERLARHIQPGYQSDDVELNNICLSLSRGIEYALTYVEPPPPPKAVEQLPMVLKQIYYQRLSVDILSVPAMMVLMISVKYACNFGWFQNNELEQLLFIADEIRKMYCPVENVSFYEPSSSCHSAELLTIMKRFCPTMKLGQIIASTQVKSEHGAAVVDFLIAKKNYDESRDKYIWLLVAQTDNMETNACLNIPQQVIFLVNGEGIDTMSRTGLQMPICVNNMLKFGINLLQVVGKFDGSYIILVAYMNHVGSLPEKHPLPDYVAASLPEQHQPPDYVQPNVTPTISDGLSVPPDIVLSQEVKGHNQSDLQLMNNTNSVVGKYGSSSSPSRHIHRTPKAILALPVQSQALVGPQQILNHIQQGGSHANADEAVLNSQEARVARQGQKREPLVSRTDELRHPTSRMRGSLSSQQNYSATPHVSFPNPASAILNEREREQLFSRSLLNRLPQVSTATQNRLPPAISMSAATQKRATSQMLNHIEKGGSQASNAAATNRQQGETRGQPVQEVSRTGPDQNWCPTSRMRGSVSGQQLTGEIRQKFIMPSSSSSSQEIQRSRPQPAQTSSSCKVDDKKSKRH